MADLVPRLDPLLSPLSVALPPFEPVVHAATGRIAGVDVRLPAETALATLSLLVRSVLGNEGLSGKLFLHRQPLATISDAALLAMLHQTGLDPARLCLQFTVGTHRHGDLPARWVDIDLDAQGGVAGLGLLQAAMPQFIRIAPRLCQGLHHDMGRRSMLAAIVHLAREMGCLSIATGLDDPRDVYLAREAGCLLVAGPVVHPAVDRVEAVQDPAPGMLDLLAQDRRRRAGDGAQIAEALEHVLEQWPTVQPDAPIEQVLAAFRQNPDMRALPVLDSGGLPLGLIPEARVKAYAYSQFGRDILRNRTLGKRVADLMEPCPVADINTPLPELLDSHAGGRARFGVMITQALRYCGLLSSAALLTLLAERRVQQARDENPLSRLPGNRSIDAQIAQILAHTDQAATLVYFDFDHFKPFNDTFGFRQGDRAILLFADLLRSGIAGEGSFAGHIGGDDFFAVLPVDEAHALPMIDRLLARFTDAITGFFDAETRAQGFYRGKDREGLERCFPLLRTSSVLLPLPAGRPALSPDSIAAALATGKKRAKAASDGLAVVYADADVSAITQSKNADDPPTHGNATTHGT